MTDGDGARSKALIDRMSLPASGFEFSGGQEDVIHPGLAVEQSLDGRVVRHVGHDGSHRSAQVGGCTPQPVLGSSGDRDGRSRCQCQPRGFQADAGAPADDDHTIVLQGHSHLGSATTAIASISIRKSGWNNAWTPTHVLAGGLTPEKNCATRAPTAGAIAGVYPTM